MNHLGEGSPVPGEPTRIGLRRILPTNRSVAGRRLILFLWPLRAFSRSWPWDPLPGSPCKRSQGGEQSFISRAATIYPNDSGYTSNSHGLALASVLGPEEAESGEDRLACRRRVIDPDSPCGAIEPTVLSASCQSAILHVYPRHGGPNVEEALHGHWDRGVCCCAAGNGGRNRI